MKKFSFSLGRVLEFKNQMLEREKSELSRLRHRKHELEVGLEQQEQEFLEVSSELDEKSREGVSAQIFRSYQYQLDNIRIRQAELRELLAKQEELIEQQLAQVLELSKDVSGLDKLKEHQLEEHLKAEAKAAETVVSEFVSGKLLRQADA